MGPAWPLPRRWGLFFVFNLTHLLGTLAGWPKVQTLFTASMLMVSSSAVIAKMLKDLHLEHEQAGQLALGVAVLEDVVAIVMLTLLGSYTKMGEGESSGTVSAVITGLSGFVVLIVMVALLFVPRLLKRLQARADPELQTIVVAAILFSLALAAVWAGYSMALGAFLLGAVVAELPQRHQVEHAFVGVRDIFSSVFFVSIGMLIDVHLIKDVWPWILGLGAFVLVARPLSVGLALVLTGTAPKDARRAGLCISPLGEFSFIIAQMGVEAGVLPKTHYTLAVGVSLVTVLLAPLINRQAGPLLSWIENLEPGRVRRGLDVYHGWLAQLSAAPGKRAWWIRGRPHVIRLVVEMLMVTGLLLFAETIYHAMHKSAWAASLDGPTVRIIFWAGLGLLTLLPLVGMVWSINTLAVFAAESLRGQVALSSRLIMGIVRVFGLVIVAIWLWYLIPGKLLSAEGWWMVGAFLSVLVAIFSRRLVSLRTRLHGTVGDVLEGVPVTELPQRWGEPTHAWALNLQEIDIPAGAACAGQTIAALQIRRRFGCTLVEINRQGYVMAGPEPAVALFPGDRLLALGSATQIAAARAELGRRGETKEAEARFDDARLETVVVAENPSVVGHTLRSLRIPHRTGAVVVGISRGGVKQANPSGDETVQGGDEWLVIGAQAELKALKTLLGSAL